MCNNEAENNDIFSPKTSSNQGLVSAFECWSWELRLVQGVSLKRHTLGHFTQAFLVFLASDWVSVTKQRTEI